MKAWKKPFFQAIGLGAKLLQSHLFQTAQTYVAIDVRQSWRIMSESDARLSKEFGEDESKPWWKLGSETGLWA